MRKGAEENLQMLADVAQWLATTEKLLEIIIKKTTFEAPTSIADSSSSASSSPPSSVTTDSEEKETPKITNKKRSFEALTMVEPSSSSSPPSSSVSFDSVENKFPKIPRPVLSRSDRTGLKEQHLRHNNNNNNNKDRNKDSVPCWWAGVTRKKRTPVIRRKRLIKAPPEPEPNPEPHIDSLEELRERVWVAGGEDLQLAVEKPLTATDVSQSHGRLSMPNRSLKSEFLTEEEASQMKDGNVLRVLLVDERSREFCLRMKQWSMRTNTVLNLCGDWNSVAAQNCLSAGEVIQLWSFRRGSTLCFALVKGQI